MLATSSARPRRPSGCSSSRYCRPVMLSTGSGRGAARSSACRCSPDAPSCSGCCISAARNASPTLLVREPHRALCWRSRPSPGRRRAGRAPEEMLTIEPPPTCALRGLLHRRDGRLAAEEGAQRIDVVDPAVFLERAVLDRAAHADAGRVERAHAGCRTWPSSLRRPAASLARSVTSRVTNSEAAPSSSREGAAAGLVAVGDHGPAALAHDQAGGFRADTRRAAAHQH